MDIFEDAALTCILCGETLNTNERRNSMWLCDPWCRKCYKIEDTRSIAQDCIPGTEIKWRPPRYLIPACDWYHVLSDATYQQLDRLFGNHTEDEEEEE